jgi:hypothetical protein
MRSETLEGFCPMSCIERFVMSRGIGFVAAVSMMAVVAISSLADAKSRRKDNREGYITTCSSYGNGCTSVRVRRGPNGEEFRLPGGTWISCRSDCRDALREESVDFWETQREKQIF